MRRWVLAETWGGVPRRYLHRADERSHGWYALDVPAAPRFDSAEAAQRWARAQGYYLAPAGPIRSMGGLVAVEVEVEPEDEDEDEIVHTTCKHCGQDIAGTRAGGEWRDRGNNWHCPTPEGDAGQVHEPEGGV